MYLLATPFGNHYIINEKNQITSEHYKIFSNDWKILGIQHVKRNQFIPFENLKKIDLDKFVWKYKNGNPQWTVVDSDHGTRRVWGNTKRHGIKYICEIN